MPGIGNKHKSLNTKHGLHKHSHKSEICSRKKQKVHKHGHKEKEMCRHGRKVKGKRHCENSIELTPLERSYDSGATLAKQRKTDTLPPSERKAPLGIVTVDVQRCEACGKCQKSCPAGAIMLDRKAAVVNEQLCTACGACVEVCPTGALTLINRQAI